MTFAPGERGQMSCIRISEFVFKRISGGNNGYNKYWVQIMLISKDICQLEYTPDLMSAGINYVMDALALSKQETKGVDFEILRDRC